MTINGSIAVLALGCLLGLAPVPAWPAASTIVTATQAQAAFAEVTREIGRANRIY